MLSEDELKNVPVLVFANKQDVSGALSPGEISDKLGLAGGEKGREWSVRGSCATKGEGLEEGLDWYVFPLSLLSMYGCNGPPWVSGDTSGRRLVQFRAAGRIGGAVGGGGLHVARVAQGSKGARIRRRWMNRAG